MPAAVPYARRGYDPRGSRLSDLVLEQGRIAAERERRSGETTAAAIADIGRTVSGSLSDIVKHQQDAPRREAEQLALGAARDDASARQQATESASTLRSAQSSGLPPDQVKAQLQQLGRGDLIPIYEKANSDLESSRLALQKSRDDRAAVEADYFGSLASAIKAAQYDPLSVEWALGEAERDGHDTKQIRAILQQQPERLQSIVESLIERSPTQKKLAGEEADRALRATQEARALEAAKATAADRVTDNARQATTQAETARHNAAMERLQRDTAMSTSERAAAAAAETARHNKAMEESARNRTQSRPVIAGDAQDLSDLDTSLDDVGVLRKTVSGVQGATGTAARIGASLPNVVTELTGWGTQAKQKQAVIDRVKQVIGKALEGGVLRKEDEYKYTKILPTIGDTADVVATKLDGLDKAIQDRKRRRLDSMEDAGFDVSRFRTRDTGAQTSSTKADPLGIR